MQNWKQSLDNYLTRGPEDDGFETFAEGVGENMTRELWELYDAYGFMDSDLELDWLEKLMIKTKDDLDFGDAVKRAGAIMDRAFRLYFVKDGEYSPEKAMRMYKQYARGPKMDRYKVSYPAFLDPRWFKKNYGKIHRAQVQECDKFGMFVEIDGERVYFSDPCDLVVGSWLNVGADYAFLPEQEYANRMWREKGRKIQDLIDKARKFRTRFQAEETNRPYLNLPFKWHPAIKDVLSGLSENSAGNGRNRATVQHIRLEEDYADGRLQRSQGDFLCTTASGTNGKNWSNQKPEYWYDGNRLRYPAPVTCKSCLKAANRLLNNKYGKIIINIYSEPDYVPDSIDQINQYPEPFRALALEALEVRKRTFNEMADSKKKSYE